MLGHHRIGFVACPPSLSSAVRRKEAFLAAMKELVLPIEGDLLFEGDHKITGGQFAAERIFTMRKPPSAVICSNDMSAIGLLHTAHRLGRRVPGDLSIIGFDGLFLSEIVQPALTTLHLSRQEIATRAFYALQTSRPNLVAPTTTTLLPRLVIRASTGSVSGAGSL